MEFLKKNWSKILLAAISLTGAILMLIPVFMVEHPNFIAAAQLLGPILFFLGLAVYYILKIFNDCKCVKLAEGITLLVTGLLALTFLSIGVTGFSKNDAKVEGFYGKSYQHFATVSDQITAGDAALVAGKAQRDGVATLVGGLTAVVTANSAAAAAAISTLENGDTAALYAGLTTPEIAAYGITTTTTIGNAIAMLSVVKGSADKLIAENTAKLADAKYNEKDAAAAATAILFSYVSLMLFMGAFPIIRAARKLVHRESTVANA